ncbi:hypothetical protein ABIC32_002701 [Brevundimonas sp. 1080]|uniref:hypothetical protein n=1 Tax=Brevundimonas sp. 1080 TaxID=3156405 RepID=UPI0033978C1D
MSLKASLAVAKTEEDIKDAYIKALGLKAFTKGLVDIQTEEIWFEAKGVGTPAVMMFTQLLFYVRAARKVGERIPPFLAVIDREKAAVMETAKALPILDDKTVAWPKSGSKVGKALAAQIAPHIETHFVVYPIDSHERDFIRSVKSAIKAGKIIRTPITPDNLRQVFDRWVELIGCELDGVDPPDYALLFFADIMHDGKKAAMRDLPAKLLHDDTQPVFLLNGKDYKLHSDRGYRNFWAIYHRPPEEEYRRYLLERRDSLLPLDERNFKGAYYTPLHIVDKAYDQLAGTLGKNWQQRYIIWDMCCGVGNLEVKHSNYRNVYMSTLDAADINVMKASQTCVGATIFQYDYLNDDVNALGEIDYSITNKVPEELRQAIADAKAKKKGAKKILVLINPPYGEAANSQGNAGKTDIAATRIGASMEMGYAGRELFVQFLARIQKELPTSTLAMFSKLKYISAPNFESFRKVWKAKYLGGFVVHSKAFDGLSGNFPIGFLIWDTGKREELVSVTATALDRFGTAIGIKSFYNLANKKFLSGYLPRLKTNTSTIPLKNAISPQDGHAKVTSWRDDAIGYMLANSNDLQNAGTLTAIFSSVYSAGNGFYITKDNIDKVAVVFSVRRLIKPTWLNDRDQFLQPTFALPDAFKSDCLIWMLFSTSNLTAGADGLTWNGQQWSLINHFIPFSENEVAAPTRFRSDFMAKYVAKQKLSPEAKAVLLQARKLWKSYHSTQFGRTIRDEFKLNCPDVGWYQVRRALEANMDNAVTDFAPFRAAYAALSDKLRPQVFSLGFLCE